MDRDAFICFGLCRNGYRLRSPLLSGKKGQTQPLKPCCRKERQKIKGVEISLYILIVTGFARVYARSK